VILVLRVIKAIKVIKAFQAMMEHLVQTELKEILEKPVQEVILEVLE
jgi:hypothetical protein